MAGESGLAARRAPIFGVMIGAYAVGLVLLIGLALARRRAWRPPRDRLRVIAVAGVLDVGGNAFFLLAAQAVGVLAALVAIPLIAA
jgi:hypothetical protein